VSIQLHTADWAVILGYLVIVIFIGFAASRRIKDSGHYFLGARKFGKLLMIGQSFGIGTHAEMPVSLAGAVYTTGLSGIWFQWKNLFATPFYWIMAPVFRRARRTTIAEIVEDRYGPWMGGIYTLFAVTYFTINTASMLKGAGKVISQAAGGEIGVDAIVIGMTVIFLAYSFVGGLVATAWTDFFQGFLIITLSFMLIPLGWSVVGGLDGMRETLAAPMLSLATPEGLGIWFIVMLTVNGLIGIMAQPHMLAAVGTGKDEFTCRVGFFYGNYVKRICTVGWAIVGLMVAVVVVKGTYGVTALDDPEDAFGFACRHLLFPGALGLLIASVMAANMSTCSAFMVDSGALFTQGFYRRHLRPNRSDRHYLWVGRVSGLVITLLGVFYALFLIERVLYSFLLTETLATYMGISIIGGLVWPRANRWGALASLVVALVTNFLLYWWEGERLDHWDPNVFCIALAAGIASLVVVSLLTAPEPDADVTSFVARLHTPSDAPMTAAPGGASTMDDPDAHSGSREPQRDVAEQGKQLLLTNLLQLRRATRGVGFFKAYRTDLVGLGIGWALAVGIVVAVWLMFRL
jgi:Na+/proline symporter